jgi:hypothetical protein
MGLSLLLFHDSPSNPRHTALLISIEPSLQMLYFCFNFTHPGLAAARYQNISARASMP